MAWTKVQSGSKATEVIVTLSEEALNNSSKDLDFSTDGLGTHMELLNIRVELTTTATVGNRLLSVQIRDAADEDVLREVFVDANSLAASLSRTWEMAPDQDTSVTSPQYVRLPPGLYLQRGQKLRIEDSAAIDAAADDMIVHVMGRARFVKLK